jgi:N-acetylglucosaminyl-diphospho-decaprenol L-rhamnosyltransferase
MCPETVTNSRARRRAGDVSVVVVTYDALPWIDRCLASVAGYETVVVDNGSSDDTVAFVRERHPQVGVLQRDNRGLAAGWNVGIAATEKPYVFLLNADAWLAETDSLDSLVDVAGAHPRAAVVGPRLRFPDGRLQPSVRGFPTPWRIATEYLFLRKLAPRSQALNAFYACGFDHARERRTDFVMGAAMLVRRAAIDEVGPLDEDFFLFSEETDWCYRFANAGWDVVFTPAAEVVHVSGAVHGGRMFKENVRGHLRFLLKHHGRRTAERARRVMIVGCLLRAPLDRQFLDIARWLRSGRAPELL